MIAGACGKSMFSFINCLPEWLYHSAFPPAVSQSARCSASLSAFGVFGVAGFDNSNRYVVVCRCSFNLHFPDDIGCGASFQMFAVRISSLLKCLLKSLVNFSIGLFIFLLLSYL